MRVHGLTTSWWVVSIGVFSFLAITAFLVSYLKRLFQVQKSSFFSCPNIFLNFKSGRDWYSPEAATDVFIAAWFLRVSLSCQMFQSAERCSSTWRDLTEAHFSNRCVVTKASHRSRLVNEWGLFCFFFLGKRWTFLLRFNCGAMTDTTEAPQLRSNKASD